MDYLSPQPDEAGIKATQELYREKLGREITEGEAREVLYRVMRWLYLLNFGDELHERGRVSKTNTKH